MSAFIVPDNHIHSIVQYAYTHRESLYLPELSYQEERNKLGQLLFDANYKSVNFRYRRKDQAPRYEYVQLGDPSISHVEFLKALQCLDYQCCEPDDWESSEACKMIRRLTNRSITLLPGYEAAAWGIE